MNSSSETPAEPMATDDQIETAMRLARLNAEGSLELTVESLRKMTSREISRAIASLQSEW